ncbi:MAG: hypothetical protein CMN37_00970 [SAR116 cluster bacterium]|nr:hypothetical protein [SAR116 cluster bacterium]
MNNKNQLTKTKNSNHKKLIGQKNIIGVSIIIISGLISSPFSYAGQPKAGDIISSMPADRSLLDKWGQATKPVKEPSQVDENITVFVKRFEFRGNTRVKSRDLRQILSNFVNKNLNFNDLEFATSLVSKEYRSRGFWAMAYLPEQELNKGAVRIQILEGKIGSVKFFENENVDKKLNLSKENAKKYILRGQAVGEMLDVPKLEESIKNLDDVPGITAAASLVAGMGAGETNIAVSMSNTELISGSVRLDNHGSNSAGDSRLSGLFNLDGLFNFGDRFSLSSLKSQGITYTSLGFNFPVSFDGTRADLSYSFLDYELGKQFKDVEAEGTANNYAFKLFKKLPKFGKINLTTGFSLTHKKLQDKTLAGVSADKTVDVASIDLNFDDGSPGLNVNFGNISLKRGNLNLSGNKTDLSMDSQTANRHGDFSKIEYSLGRLQRVGEKNYVNIAINGQVSFDNLDSSEKFSLGGPSGVRAYPTGEGMGDTGAVLRTEIRRNFSNNWQGLIFYDHGATTLHNRVWNNWNSENENLENSYQLKGAGIGLNLINSDDYDFGFYAGRRMDKNPGSSNNGNDGDGTLKKLRFWLFFNRKF